MSLNDCYLKMGIGILLANQMPVLSHVCDSLILYTNHFANDFVNKEDGY